MRDERDAVVRTVLSPVRSSFSEVGRGGGDGLAAERGFHLVAPVLARGHLGVADVVVIQAAGSARA